VNPYKHGVLSRCWWWFGKRTGKTLRLDLVAEFVDTDGKHIDATPAGDVMVRPDHETAETAGQNPLPSQRVSRKPSDIPEIETRAFAPHMLPDRDVASASFYSRPTIARVCGVPHGDQRSRDGKDYFYFEVPLEKQ